MGDSNLKRKGTTLKGKDKKLPPGSVFLAMMMLIYLSVLFIDGNLFWSSIKGFGLMVANVLPALILVFILMIISELVFRNEAILTHFTKEPDIKSWLFSIVGGIISTGPPYLWYPLLSRLKKLKVSDSLIAAFLYARSVKLPLLPLMVAYFGMTYTIILTVLIIVFSLINGVVVGIVAKQRM